MPFEFPFNLIGILLNKGFSEQAIHETCSNPCSQVGAQNKDFGAVSQLDLSRSLVPSVEQTSSPQLIIESVIDFTGNLPMKSMADYKATTTTFKHTYHFLGAVRGLYFLNFFLHSMISLHFAQTPPTIKPLICFVPLLVS